MPTTLKPVSPFYDDNSNPQSDFGSIHHPTVLLADEVLFPAGLDNTPAPTMALIVDAKCADLPCSLRSTPAPEFHVASRATRSPAPKRHNTPAPQRCNTPAPQRHSSPYSKRVTFRRSTPNSKGASSSDELLDLSSDDESVTSTLSDSSKIPKPQGEPGRPGRGGYNLQAALDWDPKAFSNFKKLAYRLIGDHLDTTKCITSQNQSLIKVVCDKVLAAFPNLENYDKMWLVTDMIMLRLKYTSGRTRRQETEIVAEKVKRSKSVKRE